MEEEVIIIGKEKPYTFRLKIVAIFIIEFISFFLIIPGEYLSITLIFVYLTTMFSVTSMLIGLYIVKTSKPDEEITWMLPTMSARSYGKLFIIFGVFLLLSVMFILISGFQIGYV